MIWMTTTRTATLGTAELGTAMPSPGSALDGRCGARAGARVAGGCVVGGRVAGGGRGWRGLFRSALFAAGVFGAGLSGATGVLAGCASVSQTAIAPLRGVPQPLVSHDGHVHHAQCGHPRQLHEGRWVYYYESRWEFREQESGEWYRYDPRITGR